MKETYKIRWRGRISGPYDISALEAMLAKDEISLLHEVHFNGEWISVDELLARRAPQAPAPEPIPPPVERPAPPPEPLGPPPFPAEEEFYVAKGGRQEGPYTKNVLKQLAQAGVLDGEDLGWKEGLPNWAPLKQLVMDLPRPATSFPAAPPSHKFSQYPAPPPQMPQPQLEASNGVVVAGYTCALVALLFFPPFFGLAAFVLGIIALTQRKIGNGIAIIVLSIVCGFVGMVLGAALINLK